MASDRYVDIGYRFSESPFERFGYCTNMAFSAKNQTNPAVTDATGYAPYIKARTERTAASGTRGKQAFHQAQAIRDHWQREGAVNELSEYARNHRVDLFRNQWECEADKKALYSRVRWEMDKITAEMEKDLEKRRSRLADLLQSEESTYLDEMGVVEEDPEDKKERMLLRYAELTTVKEIEREKMAQEKKEQQFRRNCEELRTLVSQKITRETAEEGRKILKEREQEALERNREEAMYAELWDRDRLAKELKEAREAEEKKRKGAENGQFVKDQILRNKLEKQKKMREKDQDLAVMEERKRLEALEEEYERELKRKKQVELKTGLDECIREKLKRRAKEVQDDLLEDLFFMQQIAESEEEAARCEKKRALMHEQKQYLKYLEDQIKAEAEFEKEVDRMYKDELERTWKQREEGWEREKKKRRQREQDVCSEVQEQIKSNLEKSRKVQELNKLYCQKVMEEDAEDKRRNAERLRIIREKNVRNQKQLLDQMKRKEEELREAKAKRDLELELLRLEREETDKKIQQLLSEMKIDNEHPYRVKAKEIC